MNLQDNVWRDDKHFFARLRGPGWTVLYSFPIAVLSRGGALAAMMNENIRVSQSTGGWMIDVRELRVAAKNRMADLRGAVEKYFEIHPVSQI